MTNESLSLPLNSDLTDLEQSKRVPGRGESVSSDGSSIDSNEQLARALQERERELREAYRIAKLGTWHWTVSDDVVTWSEEVYRIFRYDPALPPPTYEQLALLHAPESRARLDAAVNATLETGEPYELDVEIILPDGRTRWLCACGEVESWADGKPVKLRGTIQEITDRKLTERAKQRSEQRFRKLFESEMIGIGIPNRFGGFTEGNDELLRLTGYSRNDLDAGLVRWDRMTPPEYALIDAKHIREAARRGYCTPYEKEYIRKDGSRVPILCGYALLEGSQDEYIGFVLDLTPQKQAEAALRESEQQFRALTESLPQLVWMADTAGGNIYTNRRMSEYAGNSVDGSMGLSWMSMIHPEDLPATVEKLRHSLDTGEPYQVEYRLRRYDGIYRHFLARAVAVRNAAGQIERWIGSSTDIHEKKLAEDALRRTEKLDAAARFAASVAHEINNPLASVTNTLYLALQDPTLSEATREYLSVADQELARAAQVVTRTLRFHRQTTSAGMANLSEIMDSAYSLFISRFKACAIAADREYLTEERLYCFGDELRQVFTNLLSNALDATAHGGRVRIRVKGSRSWSDPETRGIRVVVADTGHGIPAELRKQVFEPFISTKNDTGTGLGLWVSDGIVRKHRGTIAMRSRIGEASHGTIFSLFFPFEGIAGGYAAKNPA